MEFNEAKAQFIQAWGTLGNSWGINRTMSQIHALLIISPEPLSAEQIMEELTASRGNVNMNLRALMEWGLVQKQLKQGERKEFFVAGKDVLEMARVIAKERKRREIDPIMDAIHKLKDVKGDGPEEQEFRKMLTDVGGVTGQVSGVVEKFIKSDSNWFLKTLMKLIR